VRSNARRHLRVHGLRIKTRVRSRTIVPPPSQPEALSDIHPPAPRAKHIRISSENRLSSDQSLVQVTSNVYHGLSTSNQGDGGDSLAAMLEEIEFVTPTPEDSNYHASNGRYRRRVLKDDAPPTEVPTECPRLVAEYLDKLIKPPSVWSKNNESESSDAKKTIITPIPGAWPLYETQNYFPITSDSRSTTLEPEGPNGISGHASMNPLPILKYSAPRHLASSSDHTAQLNNVTDSASASASASAPSCIPCAERLAYTSQPVAPVSPARPSLSATTHTLPVPSSIQEKGHTVHVHPDESMPQAGVSRRDGTWLPTSLMRFSNVDSTNTADEYDRSQIDIEPDTPLSSKQDPSAYLSPPAGSRTASRPLRCYLASPYVDFSHPK
jgi:hypothetical protein